MFIIYLIDLSTKKQNVKTGLHIFTKIKNTGHWKQKKFFFQYFTSEILIFP